MTCGVELLHMHHMQFFDLAKCFLMQFCNKTVVLQYPGSATHHLAVYPRIVYTILFCSSSAINDCRKLVNNCALSYWNEIAVRLIKSFCHTASLFSVLRCDIFPCRVNSNYGWTYFLRIWVSLDLASTLLHVVRRNTN